jgi:CheY-like chemotaxis protein
MTKLNYRIHWVDDTPDWVESVKGPIERDYTDSDIALSIVMQENGDEIETQLLASATDLVILDYNLPQTNGDLLVKRLRAGGNLTEIIFYSQDDTVQSEFSNWDGVHSCQRDEASAKLRGVIDRFIDRTKNVSILRGMIISEAIDCENYLTEIILKLFGDKADIFQQKILNKAYLDFEKKRMFVTSILNDRRKILQESGANDESLANIDACIACIGQMKSEIVDQRNILAHSAKTVGADGILTLKGLKGNGGGITFNNAWKNTIRENIRKHLTNLQKISVILAE